MDVTNNNMRNISITASQPARVDDNTATRVRQDNNGQTQEASRQEELRRSQIEENRQARDSREARREAEERRLEALARREEERENVIAVSEDGDTLQVEGENADISNEDIGGVTVLSPAASQALPPETEEIEAAEVMTTASAPLPEPPVSEVVIEAETQDVIAEAVEAEEELEDSAAEQTLEEDLAAAEGTAAEQTLEAQFASVEGTTAEQTAANDILAQGEGTAAGQPSPDFTGISDARLEQMYLRGEISRNDYETEIEARKERREQQNQEDEQINNRMNTIERVGRRAEQNFTAIEEAVSDEANDTLTAEQRLDIIQDLQQDNTKEAQREEESRNVWQSQFLA